MCNGDYFILYTLFNLEPVKGFKCGSNVGMFMGAGCSAGKCILNLLKAFNLNERKSMVKRVTIIKTRVNKASGDSGGSRECDGSQESTESIIKIAGSENHNSLTVFII